MTSRLVYSDTAQPEVSTLLPIHICFSSLPRLSHLQQLYGEMIMSVATVGKENLSSSALSDTLHISSYGARVRTLRHIAEYPRVEAA